MRRRSALGEIGRYLALAGGLILVVSLFFSWSNFEGSEDAFSLFSRIQYLLLILAVAIVVCAVMDAFIRWDGFIPIAGFLGAVAFGWPFFILVEGKFEHFYRAGWYAAAIGGVCALAGGLLAVLDEIHRLNQSESIAPSGGSAALAPGQELPDGWYPDPWGVARQRFWSGDGWTEQTRS
jgi:hypothetical protein